MLGTHPTWIEVSKSCVKRSIEAYRAFLAPNVVLGVVLKSNAYGHGLYEVARICQDLAAVDWLCVVSVSEALALRAAGITKPILVLSILDNDIEAAIKQNIALVVYNKESISYVAHAARAVQKRALIHCKIDTGLSRLGLLLQEFANLMPFLKEHQEDLSVQGLFTHLADAEQEDLSFAQQQLVRLQKAVALVREHGLNPSLVHAACSAAFSALVQENLTFARLGIGTYGLASSIPAYERNCKKNSTFCATSALTWYTRIAQIKEVEAGSFIGYDRTYQTPKKARLAILPVGYWDGFDRRLSNNGVVLINGHLAPIRGRIAMNMTIVEVTDIPDIHHNQPVMLLGDYPGVRADDLAARCQTINYEIVTRINPLLARIVVD